MLQNNWQRIWFLTRFDLRRDWQRITVWLGVLLVLMVSSVVKVAGVYATPAALKSVVATMARPAMVSLFGAPGLHTGYTVGAAFASMMVLFSAIYMAAMNINLAVRNSRGEEDAGVTELVRAHAVGRLAPLGAVMLELLVVNGLGGICFAGGIATGRMTGVDLNGSVLGAAAMAGVGMMFGLVALGCAQVAGSARGATQLSWAVFGLTFAGRMVSDINAPHLTWLVPLGWIEKLSLYQRNNWLPVGLFAGTSLVLLAVTLVLARRRDVGSGLLADRAGRRTASVWLSGSTALIVRLARGLIAAWVLALALMGALYGSVFGAVGDIVQGNPQLRTLLGAGQVTALNQKLIVNFIAFLVIVMALLAALPGMQTMMRLVRDEKRGLQDALFARAVGRASLYFGYVGVALLAGWLAFAAAMCTLALVGQAVLAHPLPLAKYALALGGYWPTVPLAVSVVAVLAGWLPRFAGAAWFVPAYGFIVMYFGKIYQLPDWLTNLSPYAWVGAVPQTHIKLVVTVVVLTCSVLLTLLGYVGYRRRDIG